MVNLNLDQIARDIQADQRKALTDGDLSFEHIIDYYCWPEPTHTVPRHRKK